ncbi:NAD(P)-dependent dehydrogenase, short-chain alcohol dehydrogenase family [Stigmatella aurantiaca]|uniref:NAD(P)-dependent dehydrogenase, short-chain alcohol dehydrogenase family n=1 Tax=Stigmatella aurantiaca TaxID=41 RepID=A0A1H7Y749_STIAU|nr:short chain dehydrogenase [Stigmatella aurantiaca]SEM41960.1 NAD(P)-dependent dehydrogenase, short-chain alcohol dehydrogenase family [Stigmatella aurantiaca]
MRILVIGATGIIGKAVVQALQGRHEVLEASRKHGTYPADITSKESLLGLFRKVGPVDAIISAAGSAAFKPLTQLGDADFQLSLNDKLMGQVNVVRLGLEHVRDGGSITLTSGVLAQEPMPGTSAIALVNSALEGFTRAAALEMPRGVRINTVSPPWVNETLEALGMKGVPGIPAAQVARAYVESVEGPRSGQVLDARKFTA